jgi:hypothetical protein
MSRESVHDPRPLDPLELVEGEMDAAAVSAFYDRVVAEELFETGAYECECKPGDHTLACGR